MQYSPKLKKVLGNAFMGFENIEKVLKEKFDIDHYGSGHTSHDQQNN